MKVSIFVSILFVAVTALPLPSSAAYNPCQRYATLFTSAARNFDRWLTETYRRHEQYYMLENQIADGIAQRAYRVSEAQAYSDSFGGYNGNAVGCVINSIFGGGGARCYARAYRSYVQRQNAAQYRVTVAQNRLAIYARASAGKLSRQGARIDQAQNVANHWFFVAGQAAQELNTCIDENPTSTSVKMVAPASPTGG